MPEPEILEVETPRVAELRTRQEPTPMALIQIAMDQGADIDKLTKLMELQERWEASEARKSFNAAFSAFKAEAIQIIKTVKVTDGPLKGKSYADLSAAVEGATPFLSKHGLSVSWKITKDERDWMEVACIIRHAMGHSETVTMGGPPDTGGAKNAIQARGSALSYLERYTFLAVTGLAAKDQDDDGRPKGGPSDVMPEEAFQGHIKGIAEARTMDDLQKLYSAAYKATNPTDKDTQKAFMAAKDRRKEELKGASR